MTKDFIKTMSCKAFDVEHGLGIYAHSYYCFPTEIMYDDELIATLGDRVKKCHIYFIGTVPKIDIIDVRQKGRILIYRLLMLNESYEISLQIPDGYNLKEENDRYYISDGSDGRFKISNEYLNQAFQQQNKSLNFHIVYIGQAYGKDGSRNAMDRLKKHETLQKIAIKGIPEGYCLHIMLIELNAEHQMLTLFNPYAKNSEDGIQRIDDGIDKFLSDNERERITLYEASMIRYFQPIYNKEFKNSFPSTNQKVLADCYKKDLSSIISEFNFDPPPFLLCSDAVNAQREHTVRFDLHEENDRKVFFSGVIGPELDAFK